MAVSSKVIILAIVFLASAAQGCTVTNTFFTNSYDCYGSDPNYGCNSVPDNLAQNDVIITFEFNEAVESASVTSYTDYVGSTSSGETVNITATSDFNRIYDYDGESSILVSVTISCSSTSATLSVLLLIEDTNNRSPTFNESSYSFDLHVPFLASYSISPPLVYPAVVVSDMDATPPNNEVTISNVVVGAYEFSFTLTDFDLPTKYHAVLIKPNTTITYEKDPIVIPIIAVDNPNNGEAQNSGTTTVTLNLLNDNDVTCSPTFQSPIYKTTIDTYTYTTVDTPVLLDVLPQSLETEASTKTDTVAYSILSTDPFNEGDTDYSSYFSLEVDNSGAAQLYLTNPINESDVSNSPITLMIQAESDANLTAVVPVLVYLTNSAPVITTEPGTTTQCPTETTIVMTPCPELTTLTCPEPEPCTTYMPTTSEASDNTQATSGHGTAAYTSGGSTGGVLTGGTAETSATHPGTAIPVTGSESPVSSGTTQQIPVTGSELPVSSGTTHVPVTGSQLPVSSGTTHVPVTGSQLPVSSSTTHVPVTGSGLPVSSGTTQVPATGSGLPVSSGTTQVPVTGSGLPVTSGTTQVPVTGSQLPVSSGTTQVPVTGSGLPVTSGTTQVPVTGSQLPVSFGTTHVPVTGSELPMSSGTTHVPVTGSGLPVSSGTTHVPVTGSEVPVTGSRLPVSSGTTHVPVTGSESPVSSGTATASGSGSESPVSAGTTSYGSVTTGSSGGVVTAASSATLASSATTVKHGTSESSSQTGSGSSGTEHTSGIPVSGSASLKTTVIGVSSGTTAFVGPVTGSTFAASGSTTFVEPSSGSTVSPATHKTTVVSHNTGTGWSIETAASGAVTGQSYATGSSNTHQPGQSTTESVPYIPVSGSTSSGIPEPSASGSTAHVSSATGTSAYGTTSAGHFTYPSSSPAVTGSGTSSGCDCTCPTDSSIPYGGTTRTSGYASSGSITGLSDITQSDSQSQASVIPTIAGISGSTQSSNPSVSDLTYESPAGTPVTAASVVTVGTSQASQSSEIPQSLSSISGTSVSSNVPTTTQASGTGAASVVTNESGIPQSSSVSGQSDVTNSGAPATGQSSATTRSPHTGTYSTHTAATQSAGTGIMTNAPHSTSFMSGAPDVTGTASVVTAETSQGTESHVTGQSAATGSSQNVPAITTQSSATGASTERPQTTSPVSGASSITNPGVPVTGGSSATGHTTAAAGSPQTGSSDVTTAGTSQGTVSHVTGHSTVTRSPVTGQSHVTESGAPVTPATGVSSHVTQPYVTDSSGNTVTIVTASCPDSSTVSITCPDTNTCTCPSSQSALTTATHLRTTTTKPPTTATPSVTFQSATYNVVTPGDLNVDLITVQATSSDGEDVTYSLQDSETAFTVGATSGIIEQVEILDAGSYYFEVTASISSGEQDTALVVVQILDSSTWSNCSVSVFRQTMYQSDVTEDTVGAVVYFNLTSIPDYLAPIKVLSVSPSDFFSYFTIVGNDELYLSEEIRYYSANNTLIVTVGTGSDESSGVSLQTNKAWVYVNIIDVNNNGPVFVHDGPEAFVGYPTSSLLTYVNPVYLAQFTATDADSGINAEVLYRITDTDMFYANPLDGTIYPASQDLDCSDTCSFILTASNIPAYTEGATDANLNVTVFLLDTNDIFIMTVQGAWPYEGPLVVRTLNNLPDTDFTIYLLEAQSSSASGSNTQKVQSKRRVTRAVTEDSNAAASLYLYGMYPNNTLVSSTDFSDWMSQQSDVISRYNWVDDGVVPLSSVVSNNGSSGDPDEATIIVLGVLLGLAILSLIALITYYFLRIHKWKSNESVNSESALVVDEKIEITEQSDYDDLPSNIIYSTPTDTTYELPRIEALVNIGQHDDNDKSELIQPEHSPDDGVVLYVSPEEAGQESSDFEPMPEKKRKPSLKTGPTLFWSSSEDEADDGSSKAEKGSNNDTDSDTPSKLYARRKSVVQFSDTPEIIPISPTSPVSTSKTVIAEDERL